MLAHILIFKNELRSMWNAARKIPVSIKHITSRQMIAMLLILVFPMMSGTWNRIWAVSNEPEPHMMQGYHIIMDYTTIGIVSDVQEVYDVLSRLEKDFQGIYDMKVKLEANFIVEDIYLEDYQLSTEYELEHAIRGYIDPQLKAYVLNINGMRAGAFRTEAEASTILDSIMEPYLQEDNTAKGLLMDKSVSFAEEVVIAEQFVPYYLIKDGQEFLQSLIERGVVKEEYTVVEGDTLWSISKAFGMSMDTLLALNEGLQSTDLLRLNQKISISYPQNTLLNVVTKETLEYEETIPYRTIIKKDSSVYKGETRIEQLGTNGRRKVEAEVFKLNGIEQHRDIIKEEIIIAAKSRIVIEGTKNLPASRGNGTLQWPTVGRLSSPFGMRWGAMHNGIDIANKTGTPIYAAEAGKVIFSAYSGNYGNLIKIDHGRGMVTYYAHLNTRLVTNGTSVEKGQLIGYMGSTGRSTGPHLHFEVRINNRPMDPRKYL